MTHGDQDVHFARLGYRPSAARACPMRVVDKGCQWRRQMACICLSPILDHARIWRDGDGSYVLTCEPYMPVNPLELDRFTALCTRLGIHVETGGTSPWNPGRTVLITLTNRPIRFTEALERIEA